MFNGVRFQYSQVFVDFHFFERSDFFLIWEFHSFSHMSCFDYYHFTFSHLGKLMDFYWSLSDSESPQVSRTLLSILAYLNNVVWTVSTRPIISESSNPLVTVLRAPITIVTFMFSKSFSSLARSRYLSLFSRSFNFTLWSSKTAKSAIQQVLSFWLIIIRSGRLAVIR